MIACGLFTFTMAQQVERVARIARSGQFGEQIIPIMERSDQSMGKDNRHAPALLNVIYFWAIISSLTPSLSRKERGLIDLQCVFHIVLPVHAAGPCL